MSSTASNSTNLHGLLEEREAGLLKALSAVRERLNELTLPSLLPPELLAHVFSFLVLPAAIDDKTYPPSNVDIESPNWDLITVTHVCRKWRTTAIGTPSLWTRLTPTMTPSWEVFLPRAKQAPLMIVGGGPRTIGPLHFRCMFEHRRHIQTLILTRLDRHETCEALTCLVGSLPMLSVLHIHCSQFPNDLPELPINLLSTVAPQLRELSLFGVGFPWGMGSPKLATLRHNFLSSGSASSSPANLLKILNTFSQMPALQIVDLRVPRLTGFDAESVSHNPNVVSLPALQELRLTSYDDSCCHLWSLLELPLPAEISVLAGTTERALLANLLKRYVLRFPLQHFTTLDVSVLQDERGEALTTQLGQSVPAASARVPEVGLTKPIVTVGGYFRFRRPIHAAKEMLSGLPLHAIRDLHVSMETTIGWDRVSFRDTFLPLRSVTTLKLFGSGCAAGIITALMPIRSPGDSPSLSTPNDPEKLALDEVLFPVLAELRCHRVDFHVIVTDHTGSEMLARDALTLALERRSSWFELALRKLEVKACECTNDDVAVWEAFIGE